MDPFLYGRPFNITPFCTEIDIQKCTLLSFGRGVTTPRIDHIVRAVGRLIEKFGLYVRHLKDVVSTTVSSKDRSTVQGKLNMLVDAKVLLRSAFFTDVLAEAKRFSLVTQENNVNIIKVLDAVETTKSNYERLLKKVKKNPKFIFELLNLKLVIDSIDASSEKDGEPIYQGQKLKWYTREKRYIEDHSVLIIQNIIDCFEER